MSPKAPRFLKINAVLFFLEILILIYLVTHHYSLVNGEANFNSFCSISEKMDCDVVNSSTYSEIFGVPLATLGLGYSIFAMMLSFLGWRSTIRRGVILTALLPLTFMSVVVSISCFGVTLWILKTFCILCTAVQVLSIVTFILTLMAFFDFYSGVNFSKLAKEVCFSKLIKFIFVGLGIIWVTHLLTRQLKKEIPFEAEEFIQEFRAQPILEVPVGDSPQLGYLGESPPLRLVEFADFQCPACGVATKQIHRLVKGYSGKVQLIFKHFPLDSSCNPYVQVRMHEHACVAAKAAICAQKQDKFKDFYQMLFSNQTLISLEKIKAWAEELKLNTIEFEKCLISEETTLFLQKDIDLANKIGLRSTPTFFANGRKVEGVIDENRLRALLKEYAAMD